jgi:hypothetical protein
MWIRSTAPSHGVGSPAASFAPSTPVQAPNPSSVASVAYE